MANSDAFWYWSCAAFLHVAINPAGESKGSVHSDAAYIDCPWACTRPFEPGSPVTLWATPSSGVAFAGWNGAGCEGQGNPCVATVTGDMAVTANFSGDVTPLDASSPAKPTFNVHVFMGNDFGATVTGTDGFVCSGTLNCFHDYPSGSSVTLSMTGGNAPLWFTDSASPGNKPVSYTFTLTSDRTVNPHQTLT